MRFAVIDGDILIHRCTVVFDDQPKKMKARGVYKFDVKSALKNCMGQIGAIAQEIEADKVIFVVSGDGNFRKDFLPTYKGNRTGRKPVIFGELKEILVDECAMEGWKYVKVGRLEADDVLGIYGSTPSTHEYVMCSIDKDLRTVPGLHYNWDKGMGELDEVLEDEANLLHMIQTLTGDTTDGYRGCPGLGEKTAPKVLDGVAPGEWWDRVVAEYEAKGLPESEALIQARAAFILRYDNYDFQTKEIIHWVP